MRLADHPKKLGLLLLPLVPLTAIGIVEVFDAMTSEDARTTYTVVPDKVEAVKIEQAPPPAPAPLRTTPAPPA